VCSTFDSSPHCGSIGRALEIGRGVFEVEYVPVVVAAPHLGRYVLFGNLFAAGGGAVHRIDRHPTMRRHPVTPMDEGDLRIHLGQQMTGPIALVDVVALLEGRGEVVLDAALAEHSRAILFDGLDARTLSATGRLLWTRRAADRSFAIGSSGLTHALIHHWRAEGMTPGEFTPAAPPAVDHMIVLSGSCSPVTEGQIRWALGHGYAGVRIDVRGDRGGALDESLKALGSGRSVVLYTALGPEDRTEGCGGEELGRAAGRLLQELLIRSGVRRVVVAGGDTSSHAVRQLGIHALTFAGLTVPGAPLCRSHAASEIDGVELVLKGGQIGPEDFFERVRRGS
jgi:uncharacterized protein YgbK (DUF1537 family)